MGCLAVYFFVRLGEDRQIGIYTLKALNVISPILPHSLASSPSCTTHVIATV